MWGSLYQSILPPLVALSIAPKCMFSVSLSYLHRPGRSTETLRPLRQSFPTDEHLLLITLPPWRPLLAVPRRYKAASCPSPLLPWVADASLFPQIHIFQSFSPLPLIELASAEPRRRLPLLFPVALHDGDLHASHILTPSFELPKERLWPARAPTLIKIQKFFFFFVLSDPRPVRHHPVAAPFCRPSPLPRSVLDLGWSPPGCSFPFLHFLYEAPCPSPPIL